jgi:hypothetical protein
MTPAATARWIAKVITAASVKWLGSVGFSGLCVWPDILAGEHRPITGGWQY